MKREKHTFVMSEEMKAALNKHACERTFYEGRSISISEIIREAVQAYLSKYTDNELSSSLGDSDPGITPPSPPEQPEER